MSLQAMIYFADHFGFYGQLPVTKPVTRWQTRPYCMYRNKLIIIIPLLTLAFPVQIK